VVWDERHAMYLADQGMWAQRLLRTKLRGVSSELAARLEVLVVKKRAAYEARNMERYEEVIQAMVYHARTLLEGSGKADSPDPNGTGAA
jgi:hypothetical protein